MYRSIDAISARIIDTRATGAPNRQIRFSAQLQNNTEESLAFISSSVRVLVQNVEVAEGDLLRVHTAPARGAWVGSGVTQPAELVVPLTREALSMIEQQRNTDVEVSFSASVWVAVLRGDALAAPREQHCEIRFAAGSGREAILQSKWLEMLKSWKFDETLVLELPYRVYGAGSSVALERWEKAVEHYRRGDWDEVLVACRRMLEARALEKTPSGASKPDMKRLRTFFDPSSKGEHLNTMTNAFSTFLHLGRHEQPSTEGIHIRQSDALLALSVAAAILRYTADQT